MESKYFNTIICNNLKTNNIEERLCSGVNISELYCDTINQNYFKEINCQICENISPGFGWIDKRFLEKDQEEKIPQRFMCLNCIFDDLLEKKAKTMWKEDTSL